MTYFVKKHNGNLLARYESDTSVVEYTFDELEATDVTLRLYRDGEKIGSIYNDYGTEKTMARVVTDRDESDFVSVEVPKDFVRMLVDSAEYNDMVAAPIKLEGYRLRVLQERE